MGKSSPKPSESKPYQGPQFGQQESLLSNALMGNFLGANPDLYKYLYGNSGGQSYAPQQSSSGSTGYISNLARQNAIQNGTWDQMLQNNTGQQNNSTNFSGQMMTPFKQQGFLQAGQSINGQMSYNPYQFTDYNPNFAQRSAYQFTLPDKINVGDTYTPQMEIAKRDIMQQDQLSREQQLADLNRRGLLTTGATSKVLDLQKQQTDRKLADLAAQYSIEQSKAQLAVDQQRQQMEMQRQINQAAELFQQAGASDAQAQFLAQQNFNRQQAQAQQNLAGYGANLQGRQQATAEEQLANAMRRQPLEDLYRMWAQQTGAFSKGATPGSSGLLGALGTIAGSALGGPVGGMIGGSIFG